MFTLCGIFLTHKVVLRLLHSKETKRLETLRADTESWNAHSLVQKLILRKERFIAQTDYTGCARKSYKILPLTNLNRYLHYMDI